MNARPDNTEYASYYSTYVDKVSGSDVLGTLESQLPEMLAVLSAITEEKSRHRYAEGKWSIRELWGHVNDTERAFVFRGLWFARGFDTALPGFDQDIAANGAQSERIAWGAHVEEFRNIRLSTIALFRNLPEDAWMRRGIASGNPFTVRSLAYITAGHAEHHFGILRDRYL